jgi:hypothetical protein
MKRWTSIGSVVLTTIILSGCLPEKRVVWSPDGRWAAVRGNEALYLCDAAGKLSPRLVETVASVAWLPDSRHLILSRSESTRSWDQVAAVLSDERRQELEARGVRLRQELLAHEGKWEGFKPQSLEGLTSGETVAVFVYVLDRQSEGLAEKLGEKWGDVKKIEATIALLQIAAVRDNGSLELGRVLARSVDAFDELRVASHGKTVAFRWPMSGGDQTYHLYCLPLDGSASPAEVALHTSMFSDWSADGRYLVYAATKGPVPDGSDDLRLGTLARRKVCGEDGSLLATLPEAEELAGIVFQREVRVRCLRDGRVLFATLETQLPCTAKDMPQRAGLFAVDPERQPGVTRMIPREAEGELPDALVLFEVSPDQQHVCIPAMDGRIAVLTLATGDVWEVLGQTEVDHLRIEPTWRSTDELCFAAVPGPKEAKGRPQIELARLDWTARAAQRRVFSGDWPEPAVTDVLAKEEAPPATQPGGQ